MLRILVALAFVVGLAGGANAGTWNGAGTMPAFEDQTVQKIACNGWDICPAGQYRICYTEWQCTCRPCGGPRRYYGGPPQEGLYFNFGGGQRDRGYYPPARSQCQRGWTVQDGVCKPYRGY